MKKPILLISLLACLFLTACSPRPTNPALRVGDLVVIDDFPTWVEFNREWTIESLTQDGSRFRVQAIPHKYYNTDDYQFHIVRRAPVQPKTP